MVAEPIMVQIDRTIEQVVSALVVDPPARVQLLSADFSMRSRLPTCFV